MAKKSFLKNFAEGFGRMFDLFGISFNFEENYFKFKENSKEALNRDWDNVCRDFNRAFNKVAKNK